MIDVYPKADESKKKKKNANLHNTPKLGRVRAMVAGLPLSFLKICDTAVTTYCKLSSRRRKKEP